jgi:hypothetical protein
MAAASAATSLDGVVFLGPEPSSTGNVVLIYPNGDHILLFDAATALLNAIFQDLGLYRLRWGGQGWHMLYTPNSGTRQMLQLSMATPTLLATLC